jgi:hypothetical protein
LLGYQFISLSISWIIVLLLSRLVVAGPAAVTRNSARLVYDTKKVGHKAEDSGHVR